MGNSKSVSNKKILITPSERLKQVEQEEKSKQERIDLESKKLIPQAVLYIKNIVDTKIHKFTKGLKPNTLYYGRPVDWIKIYWDNIQSKHYPDIIKRLLDEHNIHISSLFFNNVDYYLMFILHVKE